MYVAAWLFPVTAIPQIITIYRNQSAENISLLTWCLYIVFGLIGLFYAISKKLSPLIIQETLWLLVYITVVAGILIFR
jgi:uncharacterized protein with PQ loop repeat